MPATDFDVTTNAPQSEYIYKNKKRVYIFGGVRSRLHNMQSLNTTFSQIFNLKKISFKILGRTIIKQQQHFDIKLI